MSDITVFKCAADDRDTLRVRRDRFRDGLVLVQNMYTADAKWTTAVHLSVDDVRKLRDICDHTLSS